MTGKREPTSEELSDAIRKRMVIVGEGVEDLRNKQHEKRRYTVGKVDAELARIRQGAQGANVRRQEAPPGKSHLDPLLFRLANYDDTGVFLTTITTTVTPTQQATTLAKSSVSATSTVVVTVTVTAGAPAATGGSPDEAAVSASGTSAAAPSASAPAGNGNSTTVGSNAGGFSQTDLNAAISGAVTNANKPTTANSLGLDIEYVQFYRFLNQVLTFILGRMMLATWLLSSSALLPATLSF